jgi:aromatic ring-opening dioxygenase catalytic subunit (LigB family)
MSADRDSAGDRTGDQNGRGSPTTVGRREALAAILAGGIASGAAWGAPTSNPKERAMTSGNARMPTVYLPHGGGPWPFMEPPDDVARLEYRGLGDYLKSIPARLAQRPRALVVISAHWEERLPTVMTSARPPMFYDYGGFPPETYQIRWPAPGEPQLAARVRGLLEAAGIGSGEDSKRGFDHGTFVPLKLMYPEADVPTIQLSLQQGLDPARHLAIGRALAPLRDEGIALVGSGMSFHDIGKRGYVEHSERFDEWLQRVIVAEPPARDAELVHWSSAPSARMAHAREDHLLPLLVIAGAAGADRGNPVWSGRYMGARIRAVDFGAGDRA